MDCYKCDNFRDDELIKVIDYASPSPFANDEIFHFEECFKCTWSGHISRNVEDLPTNGCRCTGGE